MNPGGHGLGLNVCSMIAQKLGGSIEINSIYGKGTVVNFTFEAPMSIKNYMTHLKPQKKPKRLKQRTLRRLS